MAELLLELFSEEIPARMQSAAADQLLASVTARLGEERLDFERAESYVTPRRLTLVVDGLPAHQPDLVEERKGPHAGSRRRADRDDRIVRVAEVDALGCGRDALGAPAAERARALRRRDRRARAARARSARERRDVRTPVPRARADRRDLVRRLRAEAA